MSWLMMCDTEEERNNIKQAMEEQFPEVTLLTDVFTKDVWILVYDSGSTAVRLTGKQFGASVFAVDGQVSIGLD